VQAPEDAVREEEQDQAKVQEPEATDASPQEPAPAPESESDEPEPDGPETERDPLAEAEAKRDEYLELARRTQADFENYRKRTAKDVAAAGTRAKLGLVRDLLPVVDNLERALESAEAQDGLAEGVRLVLSDLQGVLVREGVKAVEPAGERFDPTVHEALSTRPQDGAEPGVVLDVVQKGYRMNDTVIRPARVVVSS
jgi:molecular chaperone GrpE